MNIIFLLKPKSAVAFISDKSTIRQGLEKMRYHGYNALPVIDSEGRYIGTVTEGDFLWHIIDNGTVGDIREHEELYIKDIIKKERGACVKINASMHELLKLAQEQYFAPVVDDRGVFVGIVTKGDIIRYFEKECDSQDKNTSVSSIA
ncbi:MAG: CBS domain-containing protein [Clostridia bacterium]|nr:CBS domain-containing protein [Clostridia bacterium]